MNMIRTTALWTSLLFALSHAHAQPCERPRADQCDVIWSGEDFLTISERSRLFAICRAHKANEYSAERAWQALPERERTWLVRRMAAWHLGASVLAQTLPASMWQVQQAKQPASWIESTLKTYLIDHSPGSIDETGIVAGALAKGEWQHVADLYAPSVFTSSATTANSILFVMFGDANDDIRIVAGGPTPTFWRAEKVPKPVQGRTVYLALVPRGAPLSIAIERDGQHWHLGDVAANTGLETVRWVGEEQSACIEVAIAMESTSTVYVDGRALGCEEDLSDPNAPVHRFRAQLSPDGRHELSVIGSRDETGPRDVVLARTTFSLATDPVGECRPMRFDLRQRGFKDAVALLGVEAGATCLAAGVDRARVRQAMGDELTRLGRQVKDIETWTETAEGLNALKNAMRAIGGEAIGGDRGRLDALKAVGDGAAELQRQGFGSVLSASLECSRRDDRDRWEYSLVARRLNLDNLVTAARDTVTGIDLDDVVNSQLELATERGRLRVTLNKVLADLFGASWLHFDDLAHRTSFLNAVVIPVEAGLAMNEPPPTAVISTRPMTEAEASRLCRRIELHGELGRADLRDLAKDGWYSRYEAKAPMASGQWSLATSISAVKPGTHLVHAALLAPDQRVLAEDYACVESLYRPPAVWLDLGFALPFDRVDEVGAELSGFNALASAGPADSSFEAWLGYMRTRRSASAPPSWDDVNFGIRYDARGRLPYSVASDWILLGGAWRGDLPFCNDFVRFTCVAVARRFGLVARAGVYGSVRFVDFSDLPSGLRNGRGADPRVDLGLGLHVGLRYALSDDVSLRILAQFNFPYLIDWLRTEGPIDLFHSTPERMHQVDYEDRLLFGVSMGIGFGSLPGVTP
jgi:hypothetical protein